MSAMDERQNAPREPETNFICDTVKCALNESQLDFEIATTDADPDTQVLHFRAIQICGLNQFKIVVNEKQRRFSVIMSAFVRVRNEKLLAVAEFLTRANFGLIMGSFSLNWDDGEVRFTYTTLLLGAPFPKEMVLETLFKIRAITERYMEGLMKVVFGDKDPSEAIQEIESADDRDDAGQVSQ